MYITVCILGIFVHNFTKIVDSVMKHLKNQNAQVSSLLIYSILPNLTETDAHLFKKKQVCGHPF